MFVLELNIGINNGASRFLIQSILELLAKEGVETFDFGRIPPSNHSTDGIYLFKQSIFGTKVQYNGEWISYKNSLMELLIHFLKKHILKKQRY